MALKRIASRHYEELTPIDLKARLWGEKWENICDFRITPISRVRDRIWRNPDEWVGVRRRQEFRLFVDFNKLDPTIESEIREAAIRRIQRLCLINSTVTVRYRGRTLGPPAPETCISMYNALLPMASYCVSLLLARNALMIERGEINLFADLTPAEVGEVVKRFPTCCQFWIPRLNAFLANGVIQDWPAPDVERPQFGAREGSRASSPFSDHALSAIMSAALWLNDIHDDVLSAYLATRDTGGSGGGRRTSEQFRLRRIAVAKWESDTMKTGDQFPFGLLLGGRGNKRTLVTQWPPQNVYALRRMVFLCQAARIIIVLFSTAQRIGEAAALPPDCLTKVDNAFFLSGVRFKDTDAVQGEARLWPFPAAAVCSIENQLDFLQRMGADGKFLWRAVANEAEDNLLAVDSAVVGFGSKVTTLDGVPLAEIDGRVTCHRFRYSIARLIALTLAGAPQILYDILGHDDVETTMGYALQDPEFHESVNRIRAEVHAVHMKEALIDHDSNGGRGAELVSRVMQRMLPSYAPDALGTDDMEDAIAILGEAEQVRPGVLCLAQTLERGACSSPLGIRDVGACTPGCIHRLEQSAVRQDRREKLGYLMDAALGASGGALVFYQGQILSCFEAFPDLILEFADDARLRTALRGCTPETWSGSRSDVRERLTRLFGDGR